MNRLHKVAALLILITNIIASPPFLISINAQLSYPIQEDLNNTSSIENSEQEIKQETAIRDYDIEILEFEINNLSAKEQVELPIELKNIGTLDWMIEDIKLGYKWIDSNDTEIIGEETELVKLVKAGNTSHEEQTISIIAPDKVGEYQFQLDLFDVNEDEFIYIENDQLSYQVNIMEQAEIPTGSIRIDDNSYIVLNEKKILKSESLSLTLNASSNYPITEYQITIEEDYSNAEWQLFENPSYAVEETIQLELPEQSSNYDIKARFRSSKGQVSETYSVNAEYNHIDIEPILNITSSETLLGGESNLNINLKNTGENIGYNSEISIILPKGFKYIDSGEEEAKPTYQSINDQNLEELKFSSIADLLSGESINVNVPIKLGGEKEGYQIGDKVPIEISASLSRYIDFNLIESTSIDYEIELLPYTIEVQDQTDTLVGEETTKEISIKNNSDQATSEDKEFVVQYELDENEQYIEDSQEVNINFNYSGEIVFNFYKNTRSILEWIFTGQITEDAYDDPISILFKSLLLQQNSESQYTEHNQEIENNIKTEGYYGEDDLLEKYEQNIKTTYNSKYFTIDKYVNSSQKDFAPTEIFSYIVKINTSKDYSIRSLNIQDQLPDGIEFLDDVTLNSEFELKLVGNLTDDSTGISLLEWQLENLEPEKEYIFEYKVSISDSYKSKSDSDGDNRVFSLDKLISTIDVDANWNDANSERSGKEQESDKVSRIIENNTIKTTIENLTTKSDPDNSTIATIGDILNVKAEIDFSDNVPTNSLVFKHYIPTGTKVLENSTICNYDGIFSNDPCISSGIENGYEYNLGKVEANSKWMIEYNLEVLDEPNLRMATVVRNLFRVEKLNIDNQKNTLRDEVTISIVEPKISATKTKINGYLADGEISKIKTVIRNTGNSKAYGVSFEDSVPTNTKYLSHENNVFITYDETTNSFKSSTFDLAPGESVEYTYNVQTLPNIKYGESIQSQIKVNSFQNRDSEDSANKRVYGEKTHSFKWKASEALLTSQLYIAETDGTARETFENNLVAGKNDNFILSGTITPVGKSPIYNTEISIDFNKIDGLQVNKVEARVGDKIIAPSQISVSETNIDIVNVDISPKEKIEISIYASTSDNLSHRDEYSIELSAVGYDKNSEVIRLDGSYENENDWDNDDLDSQKLLILVPEISDVIINNDDEFTNSDLVDLEITVSENLENYVSMMRLISCSNADNCDTTIGQEQWGEWSKFETSSLTYLRDGKVDNNKSICVQLADNWGNITDSICDDIKLDSTAPEGQVDINDGEYHTYNKTVSISINALDPNLANNDFGSWGVNYQTSSDGINWSEWKNSFDWFPKEFSHTFDLDIGEGIFYVRFKDKAGNISEPISDTIQIGDLSELPKYKIEYLKSTASYLSPEQFEVGDDSLEPIENFEDIYELDEVPTEFANESYFDLHLDIKNLGYMTWQTKDVTPNPVAISYHWYIKNQAGEEKIYEWNGNRSNLREDINYGEVHKGSILRINTPIEAGDYILKLDAVHEGITWFSREENEMPTFDIKISQQNPSQEGDNSIEDDQPNTGVLGEYDGVYGIGDTTFEIDGDGGVVINSGGTDLYFYPDGDYVSYDHIPFGVEVKVLRKTDPMGDDKYWYEIELSDGRTGWVRQRDILTNDNYDPEVWTRIESGYEESYLCNTDRIELMFSPNWGSRVVYVLRNGENFHTLDELGEWFKVVTEDGISGWVHSNFVCNDPEEDGTYNYIDNIQFKRPYVSPETEITSEFGIRWGGFHSGTDYGLRCGEEILATSDGEVIEVSREGEVLGNESNPRTKSNYIKLFHPDPSGGFGWESWYWHLSTIFVDEGESVKANDIIALSGNTGYVRGNPESVLEEQGCHLHFEIRKRNPDGSTSPVDSEFMLQSSDNKNALVLENGEEIGVGNSEVERVFKLEVEAFSQNDEKWRKDQMCNNATLGYTQYYDQYGNLMTKYGKGCLTTSIAMMLNYYESSINGEEVNPSNLNSWLKSHKGYSGCNFVWNSPERIDSKIELMYIWKPYDSDRMVQELNSGYPVIVSVKRTKNPYSTSWHYVLVYGYVYANGNYDFIINNPACKDQNSTSCPKRLSDYSPQDMNVYRGPINHLKLTNPDNNTKIYLNQQSIDFDWEPYKDTSRYKLFVNDKFVYSGSRTSYDMPMTHSALEFGKEIKWVVESNILNDEGNPISSSRTFTIRPEAPKIIYPEVDHTQPNGYLRILIERYQNHYGNYIGIQNLVEVATDPEFKNIVKTFNWRDDIDFNYRLPNGGKFYIRAKSRYVQDSNNSVESEYSPIVDIAVLHPEVNMYIDGSDGEDKLYQTMTSGEYTLVSRHTSDGEFNESDEGEKWFWEDSPKLLNNVNTVTFNGINYQFGIIGDNNMQTLVNRDTRSGSWSNWNQDESLFEITNQIVSFYPYIYSDVEIFAYDGRMYQYVYEQTSGYLFERSTQDGINWTGWAFSQGQSRGDVVTSIIGDEVIQTIVGKDSSKVFYRERIGEYNFDIIKWSNWHELPTGGKGSNEINIYGFKTFERCEIMRGADPSGRIWLNCGDGWIVQDDIDPITGKQRNIYTLSDVNTIEYKGRVHQVMRGRSAGGDIWMRSSADGYFLDQLDSSQMTQEVIERIEEEEWKPSNGRSASNISSAIFEGRLYQSITSKSGSGEIYIRSTADGVFDGNDELDQENWIKISGKTSGTPMLYSFTTPEGENRLYQIIKGNTSTNIYSRYTIDGNFDDSADHELFVQIPGRTIGNINTVEYQGKLYQTVRSEDAESGRHFMRVSTSGNFDEADANWILQDGEVSSDIKMATQTVEVNGSFNEILYQTAKGQTDNKIFIRSTSDGSFDGIDSNGGNALNLNEYWKEMGGRSSSNINITSYSIGDQNNLYASLRGTSGKDFYNYSPSGSFIENPFISSEKQIDGDIESIEFQGKLYQFTKDTNLNIIQRSTRDGIFDRSVDGYAPQRDLREAWHQTLPQDAWKLQKGETANNINGIEFNGKYYQAIRGKDSDSIFMRVSSDGIFESIDEEWIKQTGGSASDVAMEVFDGKLYQSIRGSSGSIYFRSTADGIFDSPDEGWIESSSKIKAIHNTDLEVFDGRLYQTATLGDGTYRLAVRSTADGDFEGSGEKWIILPGQTKGSINMASHLDKLYFVIKGYSNTRNILYSTIDNNSATMTLNWQHIPGEAFSDISAHSHNGKLYLGVQTEEGFASFKIASDHDLITPQWNTEEEQKPINGGVKISSFNNQVYYLARDSRGRIWCKNFNS